MLDALAQKGVNRISIGMQSAHAEELDLLGRTHTANQAEMAVKAAHRAGITNVSMDLMVGIQKQTEQSLKESIAFCRRNKPYFCLFAENRAEHAIRSATKYAPFAG